MIKLLPVPPQSAQVASCSQLDPQYAPCDPPGVACPEMAVSNAAAVAVPLAAGAEFSLPAGVAAAVPDVLALWLSRRCSRMSGVLLMPILSAQHFVGTRSRSIDGDMSIGPMRLQTPPPVPTMGV